MPFNIAQFLPIVLTWTILSAGTAFSSSNVKSCFAIKTLFWNETWGFVGERLGYVCLQPCQKTGSTLSSGKTSQFSAAVRLPHCPAIQEVHQQPRVLCHLWQQGCCHRWESTRLRRSLTAAGSPCTLDQVLQCSDVYWKTGPRYSWLQGTVFAAFPPSLYCAFLCNSQEPSLPISVTSNPSTAFNWTSTDWKL